ncbi:hypothetical protein DP116_02025 [Brasilonema bromeliae SPC951]|uniref:Uncharacterized protein n=1 Tax=Brasilonema bromeliae SPC951 TaxID=385972 RepID=A0ABX1P3S2_9CYAN|nr:hypothetical protein [Brasilonema bromeliae]NMG18290.1 hypothetical protein [Brasilonema bromeliae SPC951]
MERNGVILNGTNGNDTVQASGQKSSVIGVKVNTAEVGSRLINAETESLGVGEIDILTGSPGRNVFYLGDNAKENPKDFYLGNGDQDYALIRYFDPTSEDAVYLAGNPKDYTLETINGSVNISKNGDRSICNITTKLNVIILICIEKLSMVNYSKSWVLMGFSHQR